MHVVHVVFVQFRNYFGPLGRRICKLCTLLLTHLNVWDVLCVCQDKKADKNKKRRRRPQPKQHNSTRSSKRRRGNSGRKQRRCGQPSLHSKSSRWSATTRFFSSRRCTRLQGRQCWKRMTMTMMLTKSRQPNGERTPRVLGRQLHPPLLAPQGTKGARWSIGTRGARKKIFYILHIIQKSKRAPTAHRKP